ncbi:unnamed protein product [Orchesella dallaii]|uniref:Uncharacterized protein n=1 Tax=Orchesella dallaii TaxID=48710 RepID=A0ABP1RZ19_9HEXA
MFTTKFPRIRVAANKPVPLPIEKNISKIMDVGIDLFEAKKSEPDTIKQLEEALQEPIWLEKQFDTGHTLVYVWLALLTGVSVYTLILFRPMTPPLTAIAMTGLIPRAEAKRAVEVAHCNFQVHLEVLMWIYLAWTVVITFPYAVAFVRRQIQQHKAVSKMVTGMSHITGRLDAIECKQKTESAVQLYLRKEGVRFGTEIDNIKKLLNFKPGEKSKERGNKVNGDNVTPKPTTEKNVINQDLACQRKPTTPMNLAKVFSSQDQGVNVESTSKGQVAEQEKKETIDLEVDLFISDVEEISEDDSTLTRAELQEKLARTQKKLLRLSALKPPKKPIERGSRVRPKGNISQPKKKRKVESTKPIIISDEEDSEQ